MPIEEQRKTPVLSGSASPTTAMVLLEFQNNTIAEEAEKFLKQQNMIRQMTGVFDDGEV